MDPLSTVVGLAITIGQAVMAPSAEAMPVRAPREIAQVEAKRVGKVYVGMPEEKLEQTFGEPDSIQANNFATTGTTTVFYTGKHCRENITIGDSCWVNVRDGLVVSFSEFRPKYVAK